MNIKINILLIGTPEFAAYQFKKLIKKKKYNIVGIITKKNNNIIKNITKKFNIKLFQIKNFNNIKILIKKLIKLNIDIIFLISFGFKLPNSILKIPTLGCFNLHPSLLPKWKGPSPIQNSLLYGDKETGITVIKMNNNIDSGPIIWQKKCKIKNYYNYSNLYIKLKKLSYKILIKIIPYIYNKKINFIKQSKLLCSYTKKIIKKDGLINWNNSAKKIERMIRAFYKWPKTFFYYKSYTIFIWVAKIIKNKNNKIYQIGEIINFNRNNLKIQTGKNILKIIKIQLNNKNLISINDLYNSNNNFFVKGYILS